MSSRKWSDEENIKFVQLYRQEECLWNLQSQAYRNKDLRSTAIQNICFGMNIEGLTAVDVKNKIKALRSTYYLELDKIKKSSRSGASGNVYVPKVKWFTQLHEFIKDVAIKIKTKDNYMNENSNKDHPVPARPSLEDLTTENELPAQENEQPVPENDHTPPELQPPIVHAPRSKRSKLSQMASIMAEMKKVNSSLNEKEEHDFDIFAMSVASQMKNLSEEQAIIARDEIQSILTRCKLTDIRSKNTNYNTALLPNTQFSQSTATTLSSQFVQLTQLPQSSPAATSSTTGSSLGFFPNNNILQAEIEQLVKHSTRFDNIIDEAYSNA